ncbi:alpha/beta hydrolase [Paenarthrobacter nitroguajacolicus]|uniref:Alpha/beta hydrolase n=1 Tax=Paenarthrobacter nitroguajacolicus TaxID=211146 RepID=A0A558GNL7_PAENT|nr:alpha/beta hydrolase [Paenarthrobacter nitroguajacolicus]TVU58477.1 alpha/beta hydrolase [Paenarthrobacter nitroguajacolicus]
MVDFTTQTARSGAVGTLLTNVLAGGARKREGQSFDLQAARRQSLKQNKYFGTPRGVQVTDEIIAGVPVVRFSSGNAHRGTVLTFHGGAYVLGSARLFSIQAWKNGGPDVVSVDYRLAPEHPFPAAQNDALAVYRELLSTVGADRIVVTGDSAGGGLALTLLQAVAAEQLPMPAALIAVFPWADLSLSGESSTTNNGRDILVRSEVEISARWYAGDRELDDPAVSPLFGSFRGFPRTYIPIGSRDLILDDARRVAAKMESEGVDVQLDIFDGAPHGFNAVPFKGSRQCNARARAIIDEKLPPKRP